MASLTRMPRATAHARGQPHWSAVLQQGPTLEATWGQSGPSGRRTQSLRCHPSTVQGYSQGARYTFSLALSSVSRREGKWSHSIFLPSLPLSCTCTHTPAPIPVPRSLLFSCQAQSTKLSPPANSSNPPWANLMGCSRCFLPNTKKNILPAGVWARHWAAYMGHRGRAGGLEVWVCQLMWQRAYADTCPGGGAPASCTPQTQEGAGVHRSPCCPKVGGLGAPGMNGREEGPARLLSAGQSLHACVLSHLVDSFLSSGSFST